MELLDEALAHANDAVEALRELAHGILPTALARDGLRGGIGTLVSRLLRLVVRDDGVGGARYDGSSGLLGRRDRAAAVNGRLHIVSPPAASLTTIR